MLSPRLKKNHCQNIRFVEWVKNNFYAEAKNDIQIWILEINKQKLFV